MVDGREEVVKLIESMREKVNGKREEKGKWNGWKLSVWAWGFLSSVISVLVFREALKSPRKEIIICKIVK